MDNMTIKMSTEPAIASWTEERFQSWWCEGRSRTESQGPSTVKVLEFVGGRINEDQEVQLEALIEKHMLGSWGDKS